MHFNLRPLLNVDGIVLVYYIIMIQAFVYNVRIDLPEAQTNNTRKK